MKIIEHTATNLVTKDPAGCFWIFGLFFVVVAGAFVVGLMCAFTNLHELNDLERAIAWFVSLAGISVGIWIIYTSPVIVANFDKIDNMIKIKQRGFMKNEIEQHSFKEIKDVLLSESKDDEGDPIYVVEIQLISGKKVSLTKIWLRNKEELQKIIDEINNFLK